ncbi:MAG: hypothetical protein LC649_06360 [Bacteroidales bacterium]|nr:hypothetical protein [Bacteroidales bacterium]
MKRILFVLLPLIVFSLTVATSCKGNRSGDTQKKVGSEEVETLTREIEEAVYPLPTSAEVIRMLTELEVGYIIGISNLPQNVNNYISSMKMALNMGIYGADLSYATLYNMEQEALNYLNTIRVLANELNLSPLYNERLYNEIKQSYDDRDRLVSILTSAFNGTYKYLIDNDQEAQAIMVVAGAWVEGMYITTHISETVYHVEGMVRVLMEQKKSFDLFLEIAKPYADEPSVSEILRLLEPVRVIYEGVDESITVKEVEAITLAIEKVREEMIS